MEQRISSGVYIVPGPPPLSVEGGMISKHFGSVFKGRIRGREGKREKGKKGKREKGKKEKGKK